MQRRDWSIDLHVLELPIKSFKKRGGYEFMAFALQLLQELVLGLRGQDQQVHVLLDQLAGFPNLDGGFLRKFGVF